MISRPSQKRLGLLAAVRLDDADNHVVAVALARVRCLQHLVGLADAGGGADEDLSACRHVVLPAGRHPAAPPAKVAVGIASLVRHRGHRS